jgi:predicted ATPase
MHVICPHCYCSIEQAEAAEPGEVLCPACGQTFRLGDDTGPWVPGENERKPSPVDIGQIIAHYRILAKLGCGGMGVVYKAQDTKLGRNVALKFLPKDSARDPQRVERFQREARTASALNHPHICTLHDADQYEGQPFLVMELIEGQALRALAAPRRSLPALVPLVGQVAKALSAAHAAGIVHRDIKPENIMVREDGYAKVVDFGLARLLPTGVIPSEDAAAEVTDPGTLLGTVRYMSPEQARGEPVTGATDVFALGIVLYELATGCHPFSADSPVGVLHAILTQPPLPPARMNPEIPAPLEALILQMLEKDARLRPTAAEVDAALAELTGKGSGLSRGPAVAPVRRHTVGRQKERAELRAGFEMAAAGRGLFLCVTGEPGIGKTTLVEDFLAEVAATGRPCALGRGRCSERLAGTEAYLPFLEALESLLHGEGGPAVAPVMKAVAPNWYVQVVPLAADDSSLARVLAEVKAASQERLKRELGAFVQEVSRLRPVLLFFDDLHWADASTVDLLAYLGSKCAGLPVLLVLTYRPTDMALSKHPFGPVKLDLQARGVCREVALEFLARADVEHYLALEFPEHRFPEEFADLVHAKTEGSPLFMADLLRYLRDRQVLIPEQGGWTLGQSIPDLQRELPESVRSMIQRKIDQLGEDDRRLLVAASVQGQEFDAAVLARVLSRDAAEVEERLDELDRVHAFVRLVREQEFPDRTLTLRYRFVHGLYQNALYGSLRPTRRGSLSAAVAQVLEEYYGEKSATVAAELALLWEAARDFSRAAEYFRQAAQNAVRVFANQEAVVLARCGLQLLGALPDTPDRARKELTLQMTLGTPLMLTNHWTAPEVERTYSRAHELCQQLGETPDLFPALWGLWLFHMSRAEIPTALSLGEQLLSLAQRAQDPALLLQAHHALGPTYVNTGDWTAAQMHLEQSIALYDPQRHRSHALLYGGHDPCVCCLTFAAQSLWMLGYPDQAVLRSRQALALARELSHPASLVHGLFFIGMFRQFRRDVHETQELAEALQGLVAEQGLRLYLAGGPVLRGWALAERGHEEDGLALIYQGLAAPALSAFWRVYFLALLAEVCGKAGKVEEGLAALAEALRAVEDKGVGFYEPELHRLKGELLLARAPENQEEAQACFHEAIACARRQGARSLELRAVMSLSRLYQEQGTAAEARPLLADSYGWFTEGFDTADLREAKALLQVLSGE